MKRLAIVLFFAAIITVPGHSMVNGRDIIVTMDKIQLIPNRSDKNRATITLNQPTINYKVQFGMNESTPLTPSRFVNLWSTPTSGTDSFAANHPNATLTFWDSRREYVEMNFVIRNTTVSSNGITLDVEFLGDQNPIHISQAATSNHTASSTYIPVAQFNNKLGGQILSGVMIVDSSPWDPRD